MHRRILVLPGGAVRGLIQSSFLAEYERHFKVACAKHFDLIVGGSVGSVNGCALAYGVPASTLCYVELTNMKYMFTPRSTWNPINWFRPKFDRDRIFKITRQFLNRDAKMSDLLTKFISATWCINTKSCVFLKSHDEKDSKLQLEDVMAWSFAAPLYFGMMNDPKTQRTYTDPGVGDKNNPLDFAYQEALRLGWVSEDSEDTIEILCVGTGTNSEPIPFQETRDYGFIKQIFTSFRQGSSDGVSNFDIEQMRQTSETYKSKVKFTAVNCELTAKQAEFGNTDYLEDFALLGKEMFKHFLEKNRS